MALDHLRPVGHLSFLLHHVHLANVLRLDERMHDGKSFLRVPDEANGFGEARVEVRRAFELAAKHADGLDDLLDLGEEACACRSLSETGELERQAHVPTWKTARLSSMCPK